MKITERQFQPYLDVIPPVIWAWIYGELKNTDVKSVFHSFLFDENANLRNLTRPWMKVEFNDLVSKFPEVKAVAMRAAIDYYVRNSWRKWFPWNWKR